MKAFTFFTICLLFSGFIYAQSPKITYDFPDKIPGWLAVAKVPAAGVAVIKNGQLDYSGVFGELRKGKAAPPNSIFNVASLTKPIVTMLTLRLVDEGKWDIDEPLFHYWTDPDIEDDPRNKMLTTRIVLSHRTGFLNWRWEKGGTRLAFQFDPGTRFQYSGEGYEYLRKALEKKFGRSLESLAAEYIFKPLDMPDTRFTWDSSFEERFAAWHDRAGENTYETLKRPDACAADDLMCTINDYGKFGTWVVNGAHLSKKVFDDMISIQSPINEHLSFGLGWSLVKGLPGGEYALVHTGADMGVRAAIILLPVSKRGLIVFTNGDNGQQVIKNIVTAALDCGSFIIEYMNH